MQFCMESDEIERFQSDTYLADFDDRHVPVPIVENNGIVLYWYRSLRLRRVLLALRLGHKYTTHPVKLMICCTIIITVRNVAR